MDYFTISVTNQDIVKEEPVTLVSPKNHSMPFETIFLSNIDQAVTFPVETVFFFDVPQDKSSSSTLDICLKVKQAVSEVLLVPYYFMAGRLRFNQQTNRLELVCNNGGVLFVSATSRLRLKDLGNLSLPNSTFHHFVHRPGLYKTLDETALFTIQVTRLACGGFSIGFVTNHAILDGKSASEMFENLASICKGEGLQNKVIYNDRTWLKARNPLLIKYHHKEYIKLNKKSLLASCFTAPEQSSPSPLIFSKTYTHKLFSFTHEMITNLKKKAMIKCSSFEALVAHIWRERSRAVFTNFDDFSAVLFAVDIRSKTLPPLPNNFAGNAVVTAFANAKVIDLVEKPFSFCVEKIKEAREKINYEYVRSVIDWLEVYRGIPATCKGNFYVSAWWKLRFNELDFGFGKPIYGGPVVSGNDEFVLLLSNGKCGDNNNGGGGINVWLGLEPDKMKKLMVHIFEI